MDWNRVSELSVHQRLIVLGFAIKLLIQEGKASLEDCEWYYFCGIAVRRIREVVVALAA
jgi:hypothetical protein